MSADNPVRVLDPAVARKIAAGEVIDRPCAIVRELIDNAIDASPTEINVEIRGGGIDCVRVQDNGVGMTREDLDTCARPHATSKLREDTDLLNLTTMGFRGEALSSIASVARLTITSGGYCMRASNVCDREITPVALTRGTAVMAEGLFENFPARRHFLKRPQAEGAMCRAMFIEKAISKPEIKFTLTMEGVRTSTLIVCSSPTPLRDRFVAAILNGKEPLFNEVKEQSKNGDWSFTVVLGDSAIYRPTRRDIYIYVNKRRIQEFSLVEAIEYGALGYFPNGTYPVALLFVTMKPSLVDFNIHPAKKEARFRDIAPLHHAVSTAVREFYLDRAKQSTASAKMEANRTLDAHFTAIGKQGATWGRKIMQQGANANDALQNRSSLNTSRLTLADDRFVSFLGVALGVFLVVEKDDVLYLIDQHAAHERLLYDQMIKGADKQSLLVPYTIECENDGDDAYLRTIAPHLTRAGFDTQDAGDGKWEVWSTPSLWRGGEDDLREAILEERTDASEIIRRVAAKSACKDAVKDGTYMDNESARKLAMSALKLSDPHCPHGRPIWCAFTKAELFSMVRRT